mgnify:FL=1|tara:strand:+ start:186 stop:1691 length:1506 start_codon:yes stop_codon:yes gene_type:complete
MPFDRVTTGTKRVVEFLEGPDGGAGLFKELGVDGYNKNNGNKFVRIEAKPKGTIIKVDYQTDVSDVNITKIWKSLTKKYGLVDGPKVGPKYTSVFIGTEDVERNVKEIRFEKTQPGGGGVIPTDIQERGATIVLTHALKSKGAKFNSDADIRNDKATWTELSKCFSGWEHRIDGWLWTYYQQNKRFFDVYSAGTWEEFKFGSQDFVQFFKEHMDHLNRDFKNPDGTEPAGKYETWNPADIWAVKKGRMQKIKDEIKKAIPDPSHLLELNGILVNYMENHELVGISLKKVNAPREAEIHLHNVEGSKKLKKIVGVFSKLEQYDMGDIKFEPDNILKLSSVTTYIRLGPNSKFTISITRSGNNTSFTAQIKRTPDAQGGQTPINQVIKLLKGNEFSKKHDNYPKDARTFMLTANQNLYKKYYKLVSKHAKDKSKVLKWDEWREELEFLYTRDVRDAKVTLMQLSFWYSALTHHLRDPEFWTDMLYYGMKITSKGEFAPHAKIS